jgi:CHASE1-domain containing sensor protein
MQAQTSPYIAPGFSGSKSLVMPSANSEMKTSSHLMARVAITLGIGFAIAIALFTIVRNNEAAQLDLELSTRSAAHVSAIRAALDHDVEVLNAIAALVEITPDLDRTGFELFTRQFLSDHDEVKSLAWVPRVLGSDRSLFEIAATDRFKEFKIKERDNSGSIVEAAQRDEYFPIFIIQPLASNLSASGFDLSSDPVRNALLEKTREYGSAVASAPMALITDTASPREFLMVTPIYAGGVRPHSPEEEQELLTGFAIGVFKIDELVSNAFAPFEFSPVEFRLDDVSFSRTPILSSSGIKRITSPGAGTGSPVVTEEIQVYGRTWSLNSALPGVAVDEIRTSAPWIVLLGALIITMGVAGYLVRRQGHIQKELTSRNTERSRVLAINAELKDSVLNRNAEVDVLDQELTHAIRELSTLANMGRAVSAQKELDGVFYEIAQALPSLVKYDRLEISLFDGSGDDLNIVYVDGLALPSENDLSYSPSSERKPDPIPGIDRAFYYNDGAPEWEERRNVGLKSWIGVPMTTGSSNVGVIKIGSKIRNTYGEQDMARLGRLPYISRQRPGRRCYRKN